MVSFSLSPDAGEIFLELAADLSLFLGGKAGGLEGSGGGGEPSGESEVGFEVRVNWVPMSAASKSHLPYKCKMELHFGRLSAGTIFSEIPWEQRKTD